MFNSNLPDWAQSLLAVGLFALIFLPMILGYQLIEARQESRRLRGIRGTPASERKLRGTIARIGGMFKNRIESFISESKVSKLTLDVRKGPRMYILYVWDESEGFVYGIWIDMPGADRVSIKGVRPDYSRDAERPDLDDQSLELFITGVIDYLGTFHQLNQLA